MLRSCEKFLFFTLWLGICSLLFGGSAQAEEAPTSEDSDSPAAEDTIEIRAPRIREDELRPSAQFNLLRPEDLGPGLHNLGELARLAPSVRLLDMGGQGQPLTLGLRGASAKQTRILLDGVPLPDMLGAGVDLSSLPLDFLQRVEILRGAASVGVGSGALGGRVELRSRNLGRPGAFARLSAGSFGTWSAALGGAWRAGDARVMLLGSGLTSAGDFVYPDDGGTPNNPFDDRDAIRANNDARHGALLLKLDKPIGKRLRLELLQTLQAHERGVAGMLGFTSLRAREESVASLSHLGLRMTLGPGSLRLGGDVRFEGRGFQDPEGDLTGVPIDQAQEQISSGLSAVYAWSPTEGLLVQSRLDARRESLADPRFGDPERSSLAVSGASEWRPLGDDRLVASLALRLEEVEGAGLQWAPAIGLLWRPGVGLELRGNLARAYRLPSFAELYLEAGYAMGNPNLLPESAWRVDASVAWRGPVSSRVKLTGFFSRYAEIIVFEPGANFRFRPLNLGAADLGGLELEAGTRLPGGFEWALCYAYLYSADRSGLPIREGHALPGRPVHQAGAWLRWGRGPWFARTGLQLVGANFINAANTKELDARWLAEASVGRRIETIRIALQGRNLFNDHAQDVRGLPLPGLGFFVTISWTNEERQ